MHGSRSKKAYEGEGSALRGTVRFLWRWMNGWYDTWGFSGSEHTESITFYLGMLSRLYYAPVLFFDVVATSVLRILRSSGGTPFFLFLRRGHLTEAPDIL
jgi:hypothetical protein